MRAYIAGILACSCLLTAAPVRAAMDPAAQMLAQTIVDDAYHRSRMTTLSRELSAREAQILLQFAQELEPANTHTLKLLVEAADANDDAGVQRDALRKLIALDHGDLVAQVQYIDLLASGSQTLDARAKVYQDALGKQALDPQIRSEMAARLARISRERGNPDAARSFVKQALELNSVDIGALREWVQVAERPDERLSALVALLTANPLDPSAWVEMARILEGANVHGPAADFLVTGMEQMQLAGAQPPADLYLALGIDLGIAGRRAEANPILSSLAKLPDAPLNAFVAARLLQKEYTPPTSMPGVTTQPAPDELEKKIRDHLADAIKTNPKSPAALADALWIELSILGDVGLDTAERMKTYQSLVPADDETVARFEGWQQLRAEKLDEAKSTLEKAPNDPFAKLGLAKVLLAQNKANEAAQILQQLWSNHPSGLFAYQIAQTARTGNGPGIKLADDATAQQFLGILKQLPSTASVAHRSPRDIELISTRLNKDSYDFGEPVMLTVRISNTSNLPAPVGADGLIKATAGIMARVSGVDGENLGLVNTEEFRRNFRMEPRSAYETTVRVDQGKLADLLQGRPLRDIPISLSLVTSPQGTAKNAQPGLGGQFVPIGQFERRPYPMGVPRDVEKVIQNAGSTSGPQQMLAARMVGVAAAMLSDEAVQSSGGPQETQGATDARRALRYKADLAIVSLLQSGPATLKAYLTMTLPQAGIGDAADAIAKLASDPDRIVRMAWASRTGVTAEKSGSEGDAAAQSLKAAAGAEKDPLVRGWIDTLLEDAKYLKDHLPSTQP